MSTVIFLTNEIEFNNKNVNYGQKWKWWNFSTVSFTSFVSGESVNFFLPFFSGGHSERRVIFWLQEEGRVTLWREKGKKAGEKLNQKIENREKNDERSIFDEGKKCIKSCGAQLWFDLKIFAPLFSR